LRVVATGLNRGLPTLGAAGGGVPALEPLARLAAAAVTHRTAERSVLERLEGLAGEALDDLAGAGDGVVVVATCNRFEIYIDDGSGSGVGLAAEWLRERSGVEPVTLRGRQAAWHLFRVAAGLDSAILGDHEVVVQVRDSWLRAREAGLTTRLLDEVFHRAVAAGRRVRRETGLGEGSIGYPAAAAQLAARLLGGLDGRRLLIVGAGQAARGALKSVCSKWAPARVAVANRSVERAVEALAEAGCPGEAAPLAEAPRLALESDAVIAAVSLGGAKLFPADLVAGSPAVFIDISVPPVTEKVPGKVYLMGDVEEEARRSLERRRRWIPRAEEILREELEKLEERLRLLPAEEALRSIMNAARSLMERELALAARNIEKGVPPEEALRVALNSYTKKMARPLAEALRQLSARGCSDCAGEIARAYAEATR